LVDWYKTAGAATAPEELVGMVGFRHLHLLPEYKAVVRATEEVRVDLGALGKGYALDRAAEHLRVDWEIGTFLVECGTSSSVFSVSAGSTWQWPVVMDLTRGKRLRLGLRDGSVSGSAAELKQRHIVNPITGEYLMPMQRAWAYAPTGLLSDALSTAFTILSMEEIAAVCAARTDVGAVVARAENVEWFGTIPGSESNS
jgi:thiamine biosynthesis lipoprotein